MEQPPKDEEVEELIQTLEQQTNWDGRRLVKYQGFWCYTMTLRPVLSFQRHFKAKSGDIILSTFPKCGMTWLKALAFSISNRNTFPIDQSPLLTSHPQTLVPFLEFNLYLLQQNPDLDHIPSPRIFSTHMPFQLLPASIREEPGCRVIYVCRNPLDQFISHRQFLLQNRIEGDNSVVPLELDASFDSFCEGIHPFGPFWEHILGYWNAHLENPEKVLFLKYEDMKEDITANVKRIGEFMGCPFEEKQGGLVEEIARLCSFDSLRNLEVNKSGNILGVLKKSSFFRKGEVGDWANHLSPAMAERIKKLMESKFEGSGLMLKY